MEKISKLDEAMNKITIDMLEELRYGDSVQLNSKFELYHYCEDEIIVLNSSDHEDEEVIQIQYNREADDIVFEVLDDDLFEELINKE